ncbi:hypothetical protein [Cognatishimia sp. WU-CL00825]
MCKQRFLQSILSQSKSQENITPWALKRAGAGAVSLKPAMVLKKTA